MEIIEDAAGVRIRETVPRFVPVASPAAGAEWSVNVQSGSLWYLQSIVCLLTTSAAVANRNVSITHSDGSSVVTRFPAAATVVASQAAQFSFMRNYGDHFALANTAVIASSIPSIPIVSGMAIASVTQNIDVGDQWSAIRLFVIEVEERPVDVEIARDVAALRSLYSNAIPHIREGL